MFLLIKIEVTWQNIIENATNEHKIIDCGFNHSTLLLQLCLSLNNEHFTLPDDQ